MEMQCLLTTCEVAREQVLSIGGVYNSKLIAGAIEGKRLC